MKQAKAVIYAALSQHMEAHKLSSQKWLDQSCMVPGNSARILCIVASSFAISDRYTFKIDYAPIIAWLGVVIRLLAACNSPGTRVASLSIEKRFRFWKSRTLSCDGYLLVIRAFSRCLGHVRNDMKEQKQKRWRLKIWLGIPSCILWKVIEPGSVDFVASSHVLQLHALRHSERLWWCSLLRLQPNLGLEAGVFPSACNQPLIVGWDFVESCSYTSRSAMIWPSFMRP